MCFLVELLVVLSRMTYNVFFHCYVQQIKGVGTIKLQTENIQIRYTYDVDMFPPQLQSPIADREYSYNYYQLAKCRTCNIIDSDGNLVVSAIMTKTYKLQNHRNGRRLI